MRAFVSLNLSLQHLTRAFIKAFIIYQDDKIAAARRWVPVLIAIMAGAFSAYLAMKGLKRIVDLPGSSILFLGLACAVIAWAVVNPMIRQQSEGMENRNQSLRKLFRLPLIFSAALLSFAHGANDVANAVGPLAAVVHTAMEGDVAAKVGIPLWVMVIGAIGISMGLLLYGPKLIRMVGEQITKLNPMRAYCVALSAAITVIIASWLGLPVSSTHIAVGAVFGVGFFREWYTAKSKRRRAYLERKQGRLKAERKAMAGKLENAWEAAETPWEDEEPATVQEDVQRRRLVRRTHATTIAAAWVITVPAAAVLAALIFTILRLFA